MRFEDRVTMRVRYKAHGQHLTGNQRIYTFFEDTDTDTKKYVQLRNVTFVESSAHQNGRNPEYFIDGDINTGFHTPFGTTTNDKFYTVEFDTPRFISSVEYAFGGGNNGRIKNGEIQVSLDGEEWTTVKEIVDNPRDRAEHVFDFDKVVEAKYLKIVATETHGNQSGEANMYFSGKTLYLKRIT